MDDAELRSPLLTGEGMRTYPQDLRQLAAAELRELVWRLRARLALEAAEV